MSTNTALEDFHQISCQSLRLRGNLYLTASPQACVAPKSTTAVEKVYGWTPIESRAEKRTSRSLARAKPWGPTLDGMLESDSTSATDLSTFIPAAPVAPVSEDIQQTMDYNDVEFFIYKSSNRKKPRA